MLFRSSFGSMFQDFSSLTHTHKTLYILIHYFHLSHFYPFIYNYPWPFMSSHVKYTQTRNDVVYLQFFGNTYLALTLLFHLILPHLSWLQPRNEGLHFILSDNNDYDFDVKVKRCGFVSFVNDMINCGCLGCVFCFRIKKKEKNTFYINFYSIIYVKSFFFFFIASIE